MLLALRSLESAGHLVTTRGAHGGVVALGSMVPICLGVAEKLNDAGFGVTVVGSRWVKPIDPALIDLARRHAMVVASRTTDAWAGLARYRRRHLWMQT